MADEIAFDIVDGKTAYLPFVQCVVKRQLGRGEIQSEGVIYIDGGAVSLLNIVLYVKRYSDIVLHTKFKRLFGPALYHSRFNSRFMK